MWNAQFHSGPRDQVVHTIHAKIHSPIREFLSRILLENKNNYRGYNNILKGIAGIFVLSTWLEQVCRALFCLPVLCVHGICWGRRKCSFQVVCYSREKWKSKLPSTQSEYTDLRRPKSTGWNVSTQNGVGVGRSLHKPLPSCLSWRVNGILKTSWRWFCLEPANWE